MAAAAGAEAGVGRKEAVHEPLSVEISKQTCRKIGTGVCEQKRAA